MLDEQGPVDAVATVRGETGSCGRPCTLSMNCLQRLGDIGLAGRVDRRGHDHRARGPRRRRGDGWSFGASSRGVVARGPPSRRGRVVDGCPDAGFVARRPAARRAQDSERGHQPDYQPEKPPGSAPIVSIHWSWRTRNSIGRLRRIRRPVRLSRADLEARVAELERVVATLASLHNERYIERRDRARPTRSRSPRRCTRAAGSRRERPSGVRRMTGRWHCASSCSIRPPRADSTQRSRPRDRAERDGYARPAFDRQAGRPS